uniref:TATA-binding protein interacting (TIP20) domain-containing protein n=1 Tax=Panagrolaimus sp. JU765 TaxID=591449 RepID=A0AC34QER3_9BILA
MSDLIEKMGSSDKDFRFMAVNDLMENIKNKSIALDDNAENQAIQNLIKMLDDSNAEVQNLVVHCIGLAISNIDQARMKNIVDRLCEEMNNSNENIRDAASMAVHCAVKDYSSTKNVPFTVLVEHAMPHFVKILNSCQDHNVVDRLLDILAITFRMAGNQIEWKYKDITTVLFKHAESDRVGIRKRAQQALSCYAGVVTTSVYSEILGTVHDACEKCVSDNGRLKTYIMTAATTCKNSGSRFAAFLPEFCGLFIKICRENHDDEVRESIIGAFEIFFQRCPQAVDEFRAEISKIVIESLSYDPNYSYDSDNEDAMDIDDEKEGGSDDDDASDYSDDDDVSWKVRRAAAKCIEAIITYRTNCLHENYITFGPLLIKRLNEREDNVKQDILNAYMALLEQTRVLLPDSIMPFTLRGDYNEQEQFSLDKFHQFIDDKLNPMRKQIFEDLAKQIPLLIRRLCSVQKTKNVRVIVHTFVLLGTLLRAYPGSLGSHLPVLARGIKISLMDRDGSFKTFTLRFLSLFFATHRYEDYCQNIPLIIDDILKLASDSFSKVASEAIEAVNFFIRSMTAASNIEMQIVERIYILLVEKLKVADMDQEVKDKTIVGMGFFIFGFGDKVGSSLDSTLSLLSERVGNEISRQASLKAMTIIARSDKLFKIKSVIPELVLHFPKLLRKTSRSLKISVLNLAFALADRKEDVFSGVNLNETIAEIPMLLNDSDLQIAQLALKLMTRLIKTQPSFIENNGILNAAIQLSKSSLIQTSSQKALLGYFAAVVEFGKAGMFEQLVKEFLSIVTENAVLHKNAFITIAKCIATVSCASKNITQCVQLSQQLQQCVTKGKTDAVKILGILSLGELGRYFPEVYNQSSVDPAAIAISCFQTSSEDLNMMASQALGSLAVGNIQRFLPFILNQIQELPKRQYLFIYALKELITSETVDEAGQQLFKDKMDSIWNVLIHPTNANEESTRIIVAECLGKLAMMNPEKYLSNLSQSFNSSDHLTRSCALIAVRFMIQDQPIPADDKLASILPDFLIRGVKDVDIETRRLAIVLLNTIAHHKPRFIRNLLGSLLPDIYNETNPHPDLQHEVEMGPFKHLVDEGLELRKSAFECLYSLAEHCMEQLQLGEFIIRIQNGLNDHHDIKQLSYLTIVRLSEICPLQLAPHAEEIVKIMKNQLLIKPKQNSVKLENDKQEEMKRCVIKALLAMKNMQAHERLIAVQEFYDFINSTPELSAMMNEIRSENSSR